MKTLAVALLFSTLSFAMPAMAGSEHDHDHGHSHQQAAVDQQTVEKNAGEVVKSLIDRDLIDTSWAGLSASLVEQRQSNGHAEWLIIFDNTAIEDADKQKLHIFLTLSGEYIAANYTGN